MVKYVAARSPRYIILYAVVKHYVGTTTGTASYEMNGSSWRRISSRKRSIGRMYLFGARYPGICFPASSMVFETAEIAFDTDSAVTSCLRP